jgi:hypothetical protein
MKANFSISGSFNVVGAVRASRKTKKAALQAGGEYLLSEANKDVPYDVGELEGSGTVQSNDETAVVSYASPYAVRLHEHPEYNFQGGRKGKWLEDALNARHKQIQAIMAAKVKGGF